MKRFKNIIKKTVALVSALAMTVGMMAATVSAADINAIAPDKGNLYIHRYLIDDMANAGLPLILLGVVGYLFGRKKR